MMVDGDAARALGDLARERWRRATDEALAPPPASLIPARAALIHISNLCDFAQPLLLAGLIPCDKESNMMNTTRVNKTLAVAL